MPVVTHHLHHLILVWKHTCFVQFARNELYLWSLNICAWLSLVGDLLTAYLRNSVMCIKKVNLIASWLSANFNALECNTVYNACLHNTVCYFMKLFFFCIVQFFSKDFSNCFLFTCSILGHCHIVGLFKFWRRRRRKKTLFQWPVTYSSAYIFLNTWYRRSLREKIRRQICLYAIFPIKQNWHMMKSMRSDKIMPRQ